MAFPRGSNTLPTTGRPLGPGGSFKLDGLPFHLRGRSGGLAPDFGRGLSDQAQLGFLIRVGEQIAFQSGRKAALRAQGKPFEWNKAFSRMDSPLQLILAL